MDVKKLLQRYAALRLENENRLERLARLRAEAELPAQREADGSARTENSGDHMARAAERYIEYEHQIRPLIEANCREMDAVCTAIEKLSDPLEREILRLRYIESDGYKPRPWRQVARIIYGGDGEAMVRACIRVQNRALKNILCVAASAQEIRK